MSETFLPLCMRNGKSFNSSTNISWKWNWTNINGQIFFSEIMRFQENESRASHFVKFPLCSFLMGIATLCIVQFTIGYKVTVLALVCPFITVNFYRTQVSWSDLCVWLSLSEWVSETPSVNLSDVTLADKETNLILTDKVNRVMGNPRQCGTASDSTWWTTLELCNLFYWRHLMANIRTNGSDLVETKIM